MSTAFSMLRARFVLRLTAFTHSKSSMLLRYVQSLNLIFACNDGLAVFAMTSHKSPDGGRILAPDGNIERLRGSHGAPKRCLAIAKMGRAGNAVLSVSLHSGFLCLLEWTGQSSYPLSESEPPTRTYVGETGSGSGRVIPAFPVHQASSRASGVGEIRTGCPNLEPRDYGLEPRSKAERVCLITHEPRPGSLATFPTHPQIITQSQCRNTLKLAPRHPKASTSSSSVVA